VNGKIEDISGHYSPAAEMNVLGVPPEQGDLQTPSVLEYVSFVTKKGNIEDSVLVTSHNLAFTGAAVKCVRIQANVPEYRSHKTSTETKASLSISVKLSEPVNAVAEASALACLARRISLAAIGKRVRLTGPQLMSLWDWMLIDAETRGGPKRKLSKEDHAQVKKCATFLEDAVGAVLKKMGCAYRRESELCGKSTPDFVLDPPVLLNGQAIRWIDAKNFYGTKNIPTQKKTLDEAGEKYLRDWGSGCFVFGLGYGASVTFGGNKETGGVIVSLSFNDFVNATCVPPGALK
jgi:hypothetical protein